MESVTQYIIDALKKFAQYLVDFLWDWITSPIDILMDLIPDFSSYMDGLSDLVNPYLSYVNSYIDIGWGVICLGLYFTFIAWMIVVKLFIKLFIPTLG